MASKRKIVAVYRHDKFLAIGTYKQCAKALGIAETTIRQSKCKSNDHKSLVVLDLGWEEEGELDD